MKSLLVYYLTKAILSFFSLFSLPINHFLGSLLGSLMYHFNAQAKKISSINLKTCFPHLSIEEHNNLLKNSLRELGKTITELGPVWLWPTDKILNSITIENEVAVLDALKKDKGVILMTPHLGCWEMVGLYFGYKYQCTNLYQSPKIKSLDPILRHARERSGSKLLATNKRGLAGLLKALRAGQAIGILPDQTPKEESSGTYAAFFGRATLTINLPSALARKSGATVFICFARRLAKGKGYILQFHKLEKGIYCSDNLTAATTLNQSVEKLINQAPEQYLWNYKRFKQVTRGLDEIY